MERRVDTTAIAETILNAPVWARVGITAPTSIMHEDAACELRQGRTAPIIPGRRSRKAPIRYDQARYRDRHLIENAFCRLKDFQRIATRYDKLAANFLSAVALATVISFWI